MDRQSDYDAEASQKPLSQTLESLTLDELTAAEDRRLVRRIDLCLLPVMALSYMFQFLDKSALAYTAILGLREDLNLSGFQFSWSNSIYYFGYLAASYPIGLLMVRYQVSRVVALSVVIWGAVLMLTSVCHNHSGLWANRFFLGVSEAAIAPGLSAIISMWYKRSEQPLRQAGWFLGNTCAGIFGGIAAYGIGHVKSIAPWKAVFLIFGAATVAWSVGIFFLLSDEPKKAWFLSREDQDKAIKRVESNMTGAKTTKVKWYQCLEAVSDVHVWLLVLIQISGQIANGGIHSFGSIVIEGFGFATFKTLKIHMVAYVFQFIFVIIATTGSTVLNNTRTLWIVFGMSFSIAGAVMVRNITHDNVWGRFFGYCLTMGYTPNLPIVLSIISANVGGFTKRMTVNAMIFIAYCAGNIIGPQLFFEYEAPSYSSGFLAIMICYCVGLAASLVLRVLLIRENNIRAKAVETNVTEPSEDMTNAADKTDKELIQFRYVY